ncbi:DEAD/DEAH box helicase [Endozoicomonas sp.]|uniref:DEAD/DEAH box helicase n=1 Tax=Endozoicomonas sp. TaxID=1892382 RepID=UPI00383B3C70
MNFSELGLDSLLLEAVADAGYRETTAIQQQAITKILAGHDILAGAQTGTGKTAAFALPILQSLLQPILRDTQSAKNVDRSKPKALILTPTRELAQQVYRSFITYSAATELRTVLVYGGVSIKVQIDEIQQGVDILVATPGRLLDLVYNDHLDLSAVKFWVLDEADRMLDLGFKDDITKIARFLPAHSATCKRQTLLFSATLSDEIFVLSKQFLHQPLIVEVDERNSAAISVEQLIYNVDPDKKRGLCSYMIGSKNWQQVLLFTRTKKACDQLAVEMTKDGLSCAAIHGDKSQGAREKALQAFKDKQCRVLIATDVAARGLDIKQLQYVINYELPYQAEDYIHRIGRCGRAGESGLAVTLVSEEELYLLKQIEALQGSTLMQQWYPGFEPDLDRPIGHKKPEGSSPGKPRRMNKRKMRQQALAQSGQSKRKR